jgi:DNA-binding transcriptional LysR family regulator
MFVSITVCDAHSVDLRQLQTFVAVADERGFGRAADRLHVVQSAVSATIQTLERDLKVRLFDRTAHRVDLTEAGHVLLPVARNALAAAAAARDAIDDLRGGLRGTVRLGVMQAQRAPEVSVPRLLAAFAPAHPDVEVELRQGTSTAHAADLRSGRLDLAYLAPTPGSVFAGLEIFPLQRHEMKLLVAAEHRLAGRAGVELGELAAERFVDGPPSWGTRIATDFAFSSAGATRDVTYEISDIRAIVEFVHYGLAITIAPASVITAEDAVRAIPIRHHAPVFVTSIARAATQELGAAALALMETARRQAEDPAGEPVSC